MTCYKEKTHRFVLEGDGLRCFVGEYLTNGLTLSISHGVEHVILALDKEANVVGVNIEPIKNLSITG